MTSKNEKILEKLIEEVELPEGAYERAEERYKSIGNWLHREESTCAVHSPHVFAGGSFRLGTANRPVGHKDAYDLDIECELKEGITKSNHTQKDLKSLVGKELELYRKAMGIHEELDEKRRCWRLEYADHLNFHMDIVPGIPESAVRKAFLRDNMVFKSGLDVQLARNVASLAMSITDNTDASYGVLSEEWHVSNPEGYAKWFETRMRMAKEFLDDRAAVLKASIDKLPYYRWKTPLQQAIQILKHHRDVMYKDNPDPKPISAILTTLSAHAYAGERNLVSALQGILARMDQYISISSPRVPNPVNPGEDFADKWNLPEYAHLDLEGNFWRWLAQARAHFEALLETSDPDRVVAVAKHGFDVRLNKSDVAGILGVSMAAAAPRQVSASTPGPWLEK